MPKEPNRLLRVVVPAALLALGGAIIFFAVMRNSAPSAPGTTTTPSTTAQPAANGSAVATTPPQTQPAASSDTTPAAAPPQANSTPPSTSTPPNPTPPAPPAAPSPTTSSYTARTYPFTAYDPIGSTTAPSGGTAPAMEIHFSPFGAGVERLSLAPDQHLIHQSTPEVIQALHPLPKGLASDPRLGACPFAMVKVDIGPVAVPLDLTPGEHDTFWKQLSPGVFQAEIIDNSEKPVLRITRSYRLGGASAGSATNLGPYELLLDQKVENLTDQALSLVWQQCGPASLPAGVIRYGGDVRRVRFGYQFPPSRDPDFVVRASDRSASLIPYITALGKQDGTFGATGLPRWKTTVLWPNPDSKKDSLALAWAGMTSRYFTVAMYQPPANRAVQGQGEDKQFKLVDTIDRFAIPTGEPPDYGMSDWIMGRERKPIGEMVLRMTTRPIPIAAGQTADVSLGVYAGPTSRRVIDSEPISGAAGIGQVVLYTFGGPCGFCTFQAVANLLKGLLSFLHDHVIFDWALGIMLLVVCVRTVLHPITRWSQKSLYKFGKEMGKLAPKQKAIQEKYKDDPAKMREELGRLMREEGISYTGALGCLPAFLQTPVWIGLSAMIYFNFDLRHQPAFFGLFQKVIPNWSFLADMTEPDRLIRFPSSLHIPILSSFMGPIDGLNLVPLLLGVVFFIQQKYLTPPATTPLTPEQQQQQKMMKVMTVVMFPLMMYNAPAALALYFMTNSSIAILESKWIRHKADEEYKEQEAINAARRATGASWEKKERQAKPDGFLGRMRRIAEEMQKMREQQAKDRDRRNRK